MIRDGSPRLPLSVSEQCFPATPTAVRSCFQASERWPDVDSRSSRVLARKTTPRSLSAVGLGPFTPRSESTARQKSPCLRSRRGRRSDESTPFNAPTTTEHDPNRLRIGAVLLGENARRESLVGI